VSERQERKADFKTSWGAPLERVYRPADAALDYARDLGEPGSFPYTRGVQPTMYRGRLWTMRQYAGFGSAEETNKRYRYLLEQGQTGLSVAFDLPTQMGYDADAPAALGEVGKVGVSISTVEDMAALFNGIPLDRVSTSMTINATASILLALYLAVGERQGVAVETLAGTVQNDILKEYIARGTYIYPPGPSMRLITDMFAFCKSRVPRWNTISVSGYHIREAGCTAVQEVAFTLSNAIAYVAAAVEAGLAVDEFARQISFFFNAHNDLLEEVAKFRAARRLWARIMTERFHARDPRSATLRFHAQTAGSTLTAQQPENNVVRVTVQALAAVLGGCQSLHTNSMDEALALPSEAAVRIALRTQQILAHESGVADTVDPLGGSYALERLTRDIEGEAEAYIAKIDGMGGSVPAIPFMQREIQEAAYRYQMEVEAKDRVVVGVNEFITDEPAVADLFRVDPAVGDALRRRLAAFRAGRDADRAHAALDRLEAAARGRDNTVPLTFDAVVAGATLGEICDRLRSVFGVYQPSVAI
jgi:methylmalonyl-CoA mutase N-terminal domain/subunit